MTFDPVAICRILIEERVDREKDRRALPYLESLRDTRQSGLDGQA